jgi:hypothetical protein
LKGTDVEFNKNTKQKNNKNKFRLFLGLPPRIMEHLSQFSTIPTNKITLLSFSVCVMPGVYFH